MTRTGLRTCFTVLLLLLGTTAGLHAEAATTFYGSTVGQPTFNRPSSLAALSGVFTRYSVQPFFPNVDASCFIQSIQEGSFDGYIFLYRGSFNPVSPLTNLIALDDDGPEFGIGQSRIEELLLDFSNDYYLVTAGFSAGGVGTFTNTISCEAPATRIVVGNGSFASYDGRIAELLNGRFKVQVEGNDFAFAPFIGRTVPLASSDSAIFWFFQPQNFELLIKMVNGCSFNNRFWIFYAATTNVQFTVTVTDTATGQFRFFTNPLGTQLATSVATTDGFATCL